MANSANSGRIKTVLIGKLEKVGKSKNLVSISIPLFLKQMFYRSVDINLAPSQPRSLSKVSLGWVGDSGAVGGIQKASKIKMTSHFVLCLFLALF